MGITIKNLQVGYEDNIIIPKLNLHIPKEKITMIIGANGCGKSTLLKSIGRIVKPTKGEICLSGRDLRSMVPKEVARRMAILPQTPVVPSKITVRELVTFGRYPHQKSFSSQTKEDREIVEWAMKETKVEQFAKQEVEHLSGGQRQRVWIAMALAQKTDILILDEPTTYLDMAHQLEILTLLKELNERNKTTIVIVIHELNLAAKFADYLVGLRAGTLIFQGTPLEVVTRENLKKLYEIEARIVSSKDGTYPICMDFEMICQGQEKATAS